MDWQTLLTLAVSVGTGVIGYFVKRITDDLDKLANNHSANSRDIADVRLDIAKNYVTRHDMAASLVDIKDALGRIEDKLDRKQDREHKS
ncbi:MAG: hypothetical protein IPG84_18260 [Betaproteobacteria bacterium]|nr:hypothetical protein [Betaproteobacteria bacterium]